MTTEKQTTVMDRAVVPQRLLDVVNVGAAALRQLDDEASELLGKLTPELAQFIDHASYSVRATEKALFGIVPRLSGTRSTAFPDWETFSPRYATRGSGLPTLTAEQEQHLFKQYNFARRSIAGVVAQAGGKPLTFAQLRLLIAWARVALAARAQIVQLNMPLVLAMAKRTRLSGVDFAELISEGNMALLRSVDKFDCGRGFKFSTYGCRAILKSFSRVAMRASRYNGLFPVEFDPTLEKSDYLDRKRESVVVHCVEELRQILEENLAGLNNVEERVIRERFAVQPADCAEEAVPKTLEQVGALIGVTKERVRQIQNKALQKLKLVLEDDILAA